MASLLNPRKVAGPLKRRVAIKVQAECTHDVVVTGNSTGWSTEGVSLKEYRRGDWTGILELAPGDYQYRLRVDGEWRDDPSARRHVPNPFGTENCIMTVS